MPAKKKAKQPSRPPETADEYLAEAVSLEESAEKWRAGDALKAARFYTRALNTYDEAIRLFPSSFDLIYNKSRVQYEITQRPSLRIQFSTNSVQLLQTALESHRQALQLEPNDADILFNTGQVLTSLAEAIDDDASAALLLREAITLLERCLERQELLVRDSEMQMEQADRLLENQAADDVSEGVALDYKSQSANEDSDLGDEKQQEQWAAVVAPVTKMSLIETSIALLEALSSLCPLLVAAAELQVVEQLAAQLLDEKIPHYSDGLQDENSREELICQAAKFRAAAFESRFRLGLIDFSQYDQNLKQTFEPLLESVQNSAPLLVWYADALVAFANALAQLSEKAVLRYTRLSTALDLLTQASKSPNAKDLSSIHIGRGDTELLRYSLSNSGNLPANLSNDHVKKTLLANAVTYYRGAASLARTGSHGLLNEAVAVPLCKEAIVKSILNGDDSAIRQIQTDRISASDIQQVASDMLDESLVSQSDLRQLNIASN